MKYTFKVQNFDGELAVFLLQSGVSSRQVTRLRKEAGLIRCNGNVVFSNAKVKDGDVVEIEVHEKSRNAVPVCDVELDVVFEDEHFCVINKPAGMAVIATKRYYGTSLQNVLATKWGDKFVFHPVNRLDKDTSGLMIVAKNS
ncbi:MAG: RluA family pseudouridine synthase, partial [Clostridia bacterium]|nr:RluA family pseudouridine synthase [Clostridia bacterium]